MHTLKSGRKIEIVVTDQALFDRRQFLQVEDKVKWTSALCSGNYQQGTTILRRGDIYCCLGVFAEICGVPWKNGKFDFGLGEFDPITHFPPKWNGVLGSAGAFHGYVIKSGIDSFQSLAGCNDRGFAFIEIAEIIELLF